MNEKTPEELVHELLNSAFILEKALLHYVKSVCVMIECQLDSGHNESLGKTIPSLIKQIYELQNLISRKILVLSEYSNESNLHSFLLDNKIYENGLFLETVKQIYSFSKRCDISDPMRIRLREEVTQLLRILKDQQGWMELYKDNKNDPKTIWRA